MNIKGSRESMAVQRVVNNNDVRVTRGYHKAYRDGMSRMSTSVSMQYSNGIQRKITEESHEESGSFDFSKARWFLESR